MADLVTKSSLAAESKPPLALAHGLSSDAFLSLGSMEGMFDAVVRPKTVVVTPHWTRLAPGYALSVGIAALAYLLHELPVAPFSVVGQSGVRHPISPPIIAILIGLAVRNLLTLPESVKAGCKSAIKNYIPIAIVLTGGGLNLAVVSTVGFKAFVIIATCITFALISGYYLSRACGLNAKTALLIGAGTAICGNSAIVATAPLIDAEDDDIVLSIGTVNLFGLLAMLVWPVVGSWLALSADSFALWAGTSIHAVPQVVAAGFAYSAESGTLATLVKLVRVVCLAPMVFFLAIYHARRHAGDQGDSSISIRYARLVPWFVWGFVILSLAHTFGLLPALTFRPIVPWPGMGDQTATIELSALCTLLANLLLTMDMAAIGLEVNIRHLAAVGGKAVTAGLLSTLALGAASLLLILLFV